jgi:predicted phage terminase large subunit-like protein
MGETMAQTWTSERFLEEHPELARLAVPKLTRYIPHEPRPKQAAFLLLDAKDALYGGAAGGGKSDALLMAALQYVDVPGYSAILVRRTYAELAKPGALLDRSHEWLAPTDAAWNGERHEWRFPSRAVLSFGYLQSRGDEQQYQSAEYQYVGVDEITEFPEPKQPIFLFSRLRRLAASTIPLRFRAATNPIGPGAEWVERRYLKEGPTYRNPETDLLEPKVFIPATLEDNPHLDRDSYAEMLAELDPITREALRRGKWGARPPGLYFRRQTIDLVERRDVPPLSELVVVRWWDLAATEERPDTDPDYTVGLLLGFHERTGLSYVLDVVRGRWRPGEVESRLAHTAAADAATFKGDRGRTRIYVVQDPGAAGKIVVDHYVRRVLQGYSVQGIRETGSKEDRARMVSAQADRGNLVVVEAEWTETLLRELEGFPEVPHDDQVDALSGAYAMAVGVAAPAGVGRDLWGGVPDRDRRRRPKNPNL